jgi:hypothetical protein
MVFLLGLLILVLVCCWIGLCCISPSARDVTWGAPSNESGQFDE